MEIAQIGGFMKKSHTLRACIFCFATLTVFGSCALGSNDRFAGCRLYSSPDGTLRAVIVFLPPQGYWQAQSAVKIETASGQLLAYRSYAVTDRQAGETVVRARWTPDSRFFVYSLANAGGHSPWHNPTHFFSRRRHAFYGLDDFITGEAITSPSFRVVGPATVCVKNREGDTVRVNLLRLEKKLIHASARSEYDNW
jgi:hypothetical protein